LRSRLATQVALNMKVLCTKYSRLNTIEMKTKKLKRFSVFLLLLPLCAVLLGAGCEKDDSYEEISLENTKCPCEHETNFIKEVEIKDVLLFDESKTAFSEMKNLSSDDERSLFISYSSETDSTIFYSFMEISNETYTSIGNICNFPNEAKEWEIPSNGIHISFSAKVFEACKGGISVGFTQTYTDNILTTLKKHTK
jgi:hypothetical protein